MPLNSAIAIVRNAAHDFLSSESCPPVTGCGSDVAAGRDGGMWAADAHDALRLYLNSTVDDAGVVNVVTFGRIVDVADFGVVMVAGHLPLRVEFGAIAVWPA